MMKQYEPDTHPIPKHKDPIYINDPRLADVSSPWIYTETNVWANEEDNIRIYVPLDLNRAAILLRFDSITWRYGTATEKNEMNYQLDIEKVLTQLEIYDRIWCIKHMLEKGSHSTEAIDLVREIITRLENIPDGCAVCFHFETIEELKKEYLTMAKKCH